MTTTVTQPKRSSPRLLTLVLFFVGAYAWTWSFNLLKILAMNGAIALQVPFVILDVIAGMGPLLAAIAVTLYELGGVGVRALFRQLLHWRVPGIWYIIALLGPVVLALATYSLWVATGGSPPPAEALAQWPLIPVLFVYILLAGGGIDEELGWRGYALPRLQDRYGALIASVVIGIFWAGWHIPAWFTPGSGQDMISFPVFVVSTTAASIVFTWIYNSTGGGLLLVILAHTVFDVLTTGPWSRALFTLPEDQRGIDPFNLLTIIGVIVAIGIVIATDSRTLTRRQRKSNVEVAEPAVVEASP